METQYLKWGQMSTQQRNQTINNMKAGGSFASAMADAFTHADSANLAKLESAFGHLVERFQPSTAAVENTTTEASDV